MVTLFKLLLERLEKMGDQKNETVSLVVVLCMFLSFMLVVMVILVSSPRIPVDASYPPSLPRMDEVGNRTLKK
jgi:predicted PurR-regulated permease PerM